MVTVTERRKQTKKTGRTKGRKMDKQKMSSAVPTTVSSPVQDIREKRHILKSLQQTQMLNPNV